MVYKQIGLGPFYGLFALHLDEYKEEWSVKGVVDQLDSIEKSFGLMPGKRYFVFAGIDPGEFDPKSDDVIDIALIEQNSIKLIDILRARGYFVIVMSTGIFLPLHAQRANHTVAILPENGRCIGFPADTVVWNFNEKEMPRIPSLYYGKPKFLYTERVNGAVMKFLTDSGYPWTVQTPLHNLEVEL